MLCFFFALVEDKNHSALLCLHPEHRVEQLRIHLEHVENKVCGDNSSDRKLANASIVEV
jgi:hypothetical protein